jgi:glycogen operon protein
MQARTLSPGRSFPLGATASPNGVNFSMYSKNSTLVELLLFDHMDDAKPAIVIPLDPWKNRSYHYWHVFVPDLKAAQLYGYRVQGPFEPHRGALF